MRRYWAILAVTGVAALAACGGEPEAGTAGEMSAEEHARMLAGETAGQTDSPGAAGGRQPVHLTAAQARAIGVTFATVTRGGLTREVRTVGQVVAPEPNLGEITVKIDGFVERLFVNATGVAVRRGEPLLELYSPMLVSAQEELLTARRLAAEVGTRDAEARQRADDLFAAARRRLAYWDIPAAAIERLERTGQVTKTLTLEAPFDGVVLEKMVVAGQAVMPGMKLYRLADLSTVWVEGEVFEQDLALITVGTAAEVTFTAFPGRSFQGRVRFLYPVVNEMSRTARVRLVLSNRGGQLRPGMYASLRFRAVVGTDVLTVPADAVVMTGERNLVFVVREDGALEPREVVLGPRGEGRVQILSGVEEGTRLVASANFLVDAESRLTSGAGMAGMPGMSMPAEKKP